MPLAMAVHVIGRQGALAVITDHEIVYGINDNREPLENLLCQGGGYEWYVGILSQLAQVVVLRMVSIVRANLI